MKHLIILAALLSGCAREEIFSKEEFFDVWWKITDAPTGYKEYEDQYCFFMTYEDNQSFYLADFINMYYFDLNWKQLDEPNKFQIDTLFEATVFEDLKTEKLDWTVKISDGTFLTGEITAEYCHELNVSE